MKRLIIIFTGITMLALANIAGSSAQSKSKAQQYFDKREYALAIPEYEKALNKKKIPRPEQALIEGHIGMSYYYLNKPREAANWLKKSVTHGYQTAAVYCISGLALQKQEKYDDALASFLECLKIDSNYADVKRYIASCEYALAHPSPNDGIKLRSSKINTDGSEYGISPASGEVFFSRAATKGRDIDPRTGLGFTEVYSAKLEKDELVKPQKESAFMKTYYNTGVFAFDSLTSYMYMTMCDPKSGRCGIYRSKFNRRKWEKPEPFLINDQHDMAHPALAKGGSRLYFTSNAPGGHGKTDIWYADRLSESQWSEPVNAGPQINTPGRDEFPFIENDRLLYFSSDGHPGFGGLDIFSAGMDGDRLGNAENLGRPFNSGADDFNLISFGENGLLISSRNITKSDDIYIFSKKDLPAPALPEEKEEVKEPEPVQAEPEPEPKQPVVTEPPVTETPPVKEPVRRPQEGIGTFYYDFNLFVPQREYREMYENIAGLMKSSPTVKYVIEGYADDRGNTPFNRELSEKRAQYIYDRLVDRGVNPAMLRIEGFGDGKPAVPNASTEEEYRLNRRVVIRVDL
ncbi:MAG: OmpA family protein [Bacteroidales bacterium]|nr:OmpA family protein [Bacteroidales bacterium]